MKWLMLCALMILLMIHTASAQDKTEFNIRGQSIDIYIIHAKADSSHQDFKVLFAPGDGGWRGFAVTIAQNIASWGYDVYGLDTKHYLSEFTDSSTLKETEVMSDFNHFARLVDSSSNQKSILVGWSEGAGLCLLGAAAEDNKKLIKGLVTIGLPDSNILGWRFIDNLTYITKKDPNEPEFASAEYLPMVSPNPIFMIQSTADEYISVEKARSMFDLAKEPKRFEVVTGKNHKFGGNTDQFFATLKEGIEWIKKISQ